MKRPGKGFVRSMLAAAMIFAAIPGAPRAATVGPVIYHTPVPYAAAGSKVGVTALALCDQRAISEACVARIFYRTTVAGGPAEVLATSDPTWSSLVMNRDPGINVATGTLYSFFVELPAIAADTRGLDYIIKVTDAGATSWSPGTPAAQGAGISSGVRSGAWHVLVSAPSMVVHAPVNTAPFKQAIPIRADANCARNCTATLYFRRTGLLQPSAVDTDDPPAHPLEAADVQWTSVPMSIVGQIQNPTLESYGAGTFSFQADIPSAYVDTRGVDYIIKVTDGRTRAYYPGTGYNGYGAPVDGARILWQHVHVLAPVQAFHAQTQYSTTRGVNAPLTVEAVCWTTSCSARIEFHTFGGSVQSAQMSVRDVRIVGGAQVITFVYTVAGSSVVYPSLSYRFRVTDGFTNAFSPGTSYTGTYVKQDGLAVGEHTLVVL